MSLFKVEICGINTSKLPLLSSQEKTELFRRIKAGDKTARDEYIKGNLRLVLSIIQRFSGSNENVDDLFQIGCIGLMKAIDNFDLSQNVQFSTYAVPMIVTCRNKSQMNSYCYISKFTLTLLSVTSILLTNFLTIVFRSRGEIFSHKSFTVDNVIVLSFLRLAMIALLVSNSIFLMTVASCCFSSSIVSSKITSSFSA